MNWSRKKRLQTTLSVVGIRCNHCESNIKLALGKIPGVKRVKISKREQVMIEFDAVETIFHPQIVSAIEKAGYQVKNT